MKPENVQRTLDVLLELSVAIKQADVLDVVTGFGLLNEPFGDCDQFVYRQFVLNGITIMRRMLGDDFAIYISDLFQAHLFNDGEWGLDVAQFHNTFLDSHYYNVFTPEQRRLSPEEHIEQVCTPGFGNRLWDCCFYEESKDHYLPSRGMQRIVAEWSAAFDAMPVLAAAKSVDVVWFNPRVGSAAAGDVPGAELASALALWIKNLQTTRPIFGSKRFHRRQVVVSR